MTLPSGPEADADDDGNVMIFDWSAMRGVTLTKEDIFELCRNFLQVEGGEEE